MKLKNQGPKAIPVKYIRRDQNVPFDRRESANTKLPSFTISPGQIAPVDDGQWEILKKRQPYKGLIARQYLIEIKDGGEVLPGDGDPDCEFCFGRGFVPYDSTGGARCVCAKKRDIISNVRSIWPNVDLLTSAPKLEGRSVLKDLVHSSAYITSDIGTFQQHLRYVALRQGPYWFCRVRTDADMMTAWLATAKIKGVEIFDADVADARVKDLELKDLAETPDLLIMWLGVKRARNQATPEALMEILALRDYQDKPTWVVDQPNYPVVNDAHRCYSAEVLTALANYERVRLDRTDGIVEDDEDLLGPLEEGEFEEEWEVDLPVETPQPKNPKASAKKPKAKKPKAASRPGRSTGKKSASSSPWARTATGGTTNKT